MRIIKFEADTEELAAIIHFSVRTLERGFFVPHSYIKLLALISQVQEFATTEQICKMALERKIVFSEQVVRNYMATLKNFGIITKPAENKRSIAKPYIFKNKDTLQK
jgi:hypothetical protein